MFFINEQDDYEVVGFLIKEYDMKMSVIHKLDKLCFTEDDISLNEVDEVFKGYHEVIEAVDYFIKTLKKEHEVPGLVYNKLLGIAHWAREHNTVTLKQKRYVTAALASYWNERDITYDQLA